MRHKLLTILFALACAAACHADTVTTGNLAFTCNGGCTVGPVFSSTAPTFGSFTYDNTTGQFLNFTFTWNGITWSATGMGQANYNALLGVGPNVQMWNAYCIAGTVFQWPQYSCDDEIGADMFLLNGNTASDPAAVTWVSEMSPTPFPYDEATGTMTAVNLEDPVIPTPEPSALWLLLPFAFTLLRRKG